MGEGRASLLRDLEFLKLWSGQSVSLLGSQFTLLALPIAAAVTLRATPAEMGVLTALQFAPGLVFGLVAGVWLDRARRRPVMVATQLVSATALATVPLAAAMNALSIGQLYAVAFVAGLAAAFFGVAQVSFLPTLVARDRLIEANAYYQTSRTLASLIGPGLAGAAVQLLTAPIAVAVDAASFAVGAATAAWLRVSEPRPGSAPRPHLAREAIAGFTTLWRQPLVRSITSTLLMANAGGAMSVTVLVLLFVGQLGVSPAQLGLTFAAASASSLLGSLLFRPLQRQVGVGPAMVVATALLGAGVLVRLGASFTHEPVTFPLLVGGALVSGFGLMTYNIPQQAIQQAVIPNHTLGRATAAVALIINAGSVAASLGGGFLGQLMGLQLTLAVATAMTVLCAVPAVLGPIRGLRNVPAAAADQAAG